MSYELLELEMMVQTSSPKYIASKLHELQTQLDEQTELLDAYRAADKRRFTALMDAEKQLDAEKENLLLTHVAWQKGVKQLEAVRDHLNKRSFRTYSGTHKAVYVDDIERILKAAIGEGK